MQKALEPVLKDVYVYVPANAHFENLPKGWKKWFSPFYNRSSRRKFWKDCIRLFRGPATGPRIFFIEFFGRRDFFLYSLAALLFAGKKDVLWILYRDDLSIRRKKDLKIIRFFSKVLNWKFQKRFIPLTDSELLADIYAQWFGKRPVIFPVLYAQYQPVAIPSKQKWVCTWLGSPRSEKGAAEISRLVQIQDPASERIELDISGATYFPAVKNQISIHLRKAFLSEEEYHASLSRSDIALLPYDPQKYKLRTSGVFVESILAGKIPVVRDGSWLAHELKRFDLHELILDWDHPQFFTHLLTVVGNPNLLPKLMRMQQAYLAFHGEHNFASLLQNLVKR